MVLIDLRSLTKFYFHLLPIGADFLMTLAILNCLIDMFMVVLAIASTWLTFFRITIITGLHLNVILRLNFTFTCFFMLGEFLNAGKDVHVEVFAVVSILASTIFTSCHVKLELAVVVKFVVSVKGAYEDDFDFSGIHLKSFRV